MEVDDSRVQDVFSDIRKHSKLLDPVKAENYRVLMNLEEQITKKYGIQRSEITPVKYFFGIMTQLNTQTKYYRSLLYLLQKILPRVEDGVKSSRFGDCVTVLTKVYTSNSEDMAGAAQRSLCDCIIQLLQTQKLEESVWSSKSVSEAFHFLLRLCIAPKGKTRHFIHEDLAKLLKSHHANHFAFTSREVVSFLSQLNDQYKATHSGDANIFYFIGFVNLVFPFLDSSVKESLFFLLLEIREYNADYIDTNVFKALEQYVKESDVAAAKKLLDKLLAAPTKADAKAADIQGYVNIVLTIAKRVMETDKENAESLFLSVWNTLHPFLMKRETETLKVVAPIVAEFLNASKSTLEDFSEATMKQVVDDCTSWLVAAKEGGSFGYFDVFRAVIQVVGSKNPELLMPLAKEMNNQLKSNKKMRVLVTDLFNVIPLPLFMSVITIVDKDNVPNDQFLPLMRYLVMNVANKPSLLAPFFNAFLPISKATMKKCEEPNAGEKEHECIRRVWDLFGAILCNASDIETVLPNYKKALGHVFAWPGWFEAGVVALTGFVNLVRHLHMCIAGEDAPKKEEKEEKEEMKAIDEENEEEATEKERAKRPPYDEVDGIAIKKTYTFIRRDPETAQSILNLVGSLVEGWFPSLEKMVDNLMGTFGSAMPNPEGVGKNGRAMEVAFVREDIQILCGYASDEVKSRLFTQLSERVKVALKDSSVLGVRQQILLLHLFATVIPYAPSSEVPATLEFLQSQTREKHVAAVQRRFLYCELQLICFHAKVLEETGTLLPTFTTCQSDLLSTSADVRKYHVKALGYLVNAMSPNKAENMEALVQAMPRLVLCVKDVNNKIRSITFALLIDIARQMKEADCEIKQPDGSLAKPSLTLFFAVMEGCLATKTPRMKSAALMCLAFVFYHYREEEEAKTELLRVTQQVETLATDKNPELAKANLGFLRTAVKIMDEETLKEEATEILQAILPWASYVHNRFKLRVRAVVELLVRRLGLEAVQQRMPKDKQELLQKILNSEKIHAAKEEDSEEALGKNPMEEDDMSEVEIEEGDAELDEEVKQELLQHSEAIAAVGETGAVMQNAKPKGVKRQQTSEEKPSKKAKKTKKAKKEKK